MPQENDDSSAIGRSASNLLRSGLGDSGQWSASDLAEMLEHQLSASLFDLADHADRKLIGEVLHKSASLNVTTFRELLQHPRPPLQMLWHIKEYAKHCRWQVDDDGAAAVPTVLYCLALCVARLRHGVLITRLSPNDTRTIVEWCRQRTWLDDWSRGLLDEWSAQTEANPSGDDAGPPDAKGNAADPAPDGDEPPAQA